MEMIFEFEEKIHVQTDVHHIMILYENYLLQCSNIFIGQDTNRYDIDHIVFLGNNPHKK
jgi:hypothetical protein